MRKQLGPALVVLMASTGSARAAEPKTDACSLRTSSETSDAVGGKVLGSQHSDTVVTEGTSKGETMRTCMWKVGDGGMISVNVVRAPKGAGREAGLALLNQVVETLKAQGWTEERKNFGDTVCSTTTPPPSQKDVPVSTGCFAEAKGMGIGIGWMSGDKKVASEKVKGLLDKVIGRLP